VTQPLLPPVVPVKIVEPAPSWLDRVWPRLPGAAGRRTVGGIGACAILSVSVLVWNRPGISWFVLALAVTTTAILARWQMPPATARARIERIGWTCGALALTAIASIRADGWLDTWCVLAAIACGSLAVAGGRTAAGIGFGSIAVFIAASRAGGWFGRGLGQLRRGTPERMRLGRTVAVSALLVALFGTLFITADEGFAHLVSHLLPPLDGPAFGRSIGGLIIVTPIALGTAYLAAAAPPFDRLPAGPTRAARRLEWALPLALLDLLFASFVVVQLEFLFGGRSRVERTTGLTYAEYARSGFWQLLVVAALTLVVIAVSARVAPRGSRSDRILLRVLLGMLGALTLVIIASALSRLKVYDDAYGFTRERVAVGVIEAWLGVVFVLILAAGATLRAGWLPRAAAATAVLALLATAIADPDSVIANHDIDRYQRTGQIDVVYLSGLSADAIIALERLPEPLRSCASNPIFSRLQAPDGWRSWNLDRARAHAALHADPYARAICYP
jgi:Domain of unknown function (DUF4173)